MQSLYIYYLPKFNAYITYQIRHNLSTNYYALNYTVD